MLKTMKRILGGIALVATLFAGVTQAYAAEPAFNNIAGDQDFLTGRNVTQNGNFTDPVNGVKKDDEVDVAVYYHNAVPDTVARNVRIKVTLPTAEQSSHVIQGNLSADNAGNVTGTVVNGQEVGQANLTINTVGATKLNYVPGSVRWYPNRMTTTGPGANLPDGQTGDSIITTGISIGDLNGCFEFSGFVLFRVKVAQTITPPPTAILTLAKEVRLGGTEEAFVPKNVVTPGATVEYRMTIKNADGMGVAYSVRLKDVLPAGMTYVGPTTVHRGSAVIHLSDITAADGAIVLNDLLPGEQVYVYFKATSATSFKNDECVINRVTVTADNASLPGEKTAETCFSVAPVVTPKPTPATTNPPVKKPVELPKTGPEMSIAALFGMSGMAGTVGRYLYLKQQVKRNARGINII